MKNNLGKKFEAKTEFIPVPIDDVFFCPPSGGDKRELAAGAKKTVLFCGVLDERKGITCFLKAIPEVLKLNLDTAVFIVTAPTLNTFPVCKRNREKVLSLVRAYEGKIVFIEKEVDMSSLFSTVDILVYPVLTMHGTLGSPSILIEGMAMGKTVVASRFPELTEIIEDRVNGLFFNTGDSQDLAQCVNRSLKDKVLIQRLGEKAKQKSQQYKLSSVCEKIINLYDELG